MLARRDHQGLKDHRDHKDRWDCREQQASGASRGLKGFKAKWGPQALQVLRECLASVAWSVNRA
jgi:hypothetical protein